MRVLSFDVGTRSLAYCLVESPEFKVVDWKTVDLIGDDKLSMHEVSERMVQFLATLAYNEDVVLIETQRGGGFGNSTMVAISHVMQAFYVTKRIVLNQATPTIEFRSPTLKVSAAKLLVPAPTTLVTAPATPVTPDVELTDQKKNARNYKANKDVSVAACRILIDRPNLMAETHKQQFLGSKKKQREDLADSLLQVWAYCNPIPPKKRVSKKAKLIDQ